MITFTPEELEAIEHEFGWIWQMWHGNAIHEKGSKQLRAAYKAKADFYGRIHDKVMEELAGLCDTEGK